MDKRPNGFTLVELAIALMVIGLLIGGVLKGQELIENAKITRTVKDLNDIDTAVMIFRSTYNGLPGDFRFPNRIPNCDEAPCNPTVSSTILKNFGADGKINHDTERIKFWIQLQYAGLISGVNENGVVSPNYNISPVNPFNGHYFTTYEGDGAGRPIKENYIYIGHGAAPENWPNRALGMPWFIARRIDEKMDDGKPSTGNLIYHNYITSIYIGATCYDRDNNSYIVITSFCGFIFLAPSLQ